MRHSGFPPPCLKSYLSTLPSPAQADLNLTLLYNSSTYYDDLAWAAGWLYKATKQNDFLLDVYDHCSAHLDVEGEVSDFK